MKIYHIKSFLIILCFLLISIITNTVKLEGAKKCDRTISQATMVNKKLKDDKTWKKRLEEIDDALKNIERKVKDPNSDIYKKIKDNDCVTKKLFAVFICVKMDFEPKFKIRA